MSYASDLKAHYAAVRRRLDPRPAAAPRPSQLAARAGAAKVDAPAPASKPFKFWFVDCEPIVERPSVDIIQRVICKHFGISRNELLAQRKTQELVWPRQLGIYLAKELTLKSYPEIARRFARGDHTTAIHAWRKVRAKIARDPATQGLVEQLRDKIAAFIDGREV